MQELPNWGSRVFLFKNDDNNTYTNTDKNKTPLPVVVLCAKRVCRKVSVCVCFVMMMMMIVSLSFRSNVYKNSFLQKTKPMNNDKNKGSREHTNKTTLKEDKHHHY